MWYPIAKRGCDLLMAVLGLVIFSPLLFIIALAIKVSDGGSIFYRQWRVGRWGRLFQIWKFRTMKEGADRVGPGVTRDGDPRITALGRWLRKTKLDELPQLWNVLSGEMSFVGPRPEVPQYVARYTADQSAILGLKPGITDLATLEFINEEEMLRNATDVESFYLLYCVPKKVELNLRYARQASLWQDLKIIFRTATYGTRLLTLVAKPQAQPVVSDP